MTVRLSPESPRRVSASRFARELRSAMTARGASVKRTAEAAGVAPSALNAWRAGQNLPRIGTAVRLAEVLHAPKLASIVREGRTAPCRRCGRPFVNEAGGPKAFCSQGCRDVDEQLRKPHAGSALAGTIRELLAAREGQKGGVPKAPLEAALVAWSRSESRRMVRLDAQAQQVADLRSVIDAMCAACEPSGTCRESSCPLRPASPFPLQGAEARGEVRPPSSPGTREPRALAGVHPRREHRAVVAGGRARGVRGAGPGTLGADDARGARGRRRGDQRGPERSEGRVNLQQPCACGGLIVAGAPWAIAEAVSRHNTGQQHRAWRRRRELVEANRIYRARMRAVVNDRRLGIAVIRENLRAAA